ncbi:hypothetical protein C8R48DRAFT_774899 [Suillus tomentosus]|nr:hypothetical protein C8R48DRAFT_774899 [Suillus tomentosus]
MSSITPNFHPARNIVIAYFSKYEVDLVCQHKAHRLQRQQFWAAGVNDLFAVNQHDKWLRFGLALHTDIEPFTGRIMWMNLVVDMPMVMQSDPGSENFGIANAHMMLRQWHDPALQGDFGALDFKIGLEPGAIDHVRNLYVDLNHAVFELVPRDFAWNIYLDLHQIISRLYEQLPPVVLPDDNLNNDFLPLLENHEDLPFCDGNDGAYYMGEDNEPDVSLLEDTNIDESGHAGLVVWEFSDDEDEDVVDEW